MTIYIFTNFQVKYTVYVHMYQMRGFCRHEKKKRKFNWLNATQVSIPKFQFPSQVCYIYQFPRQVILYTIYICMYSLLHLVCHFSILYTYVCTAYCIWCVISVYYIHMYVQPTAFGVSCQYTIYICMYSLLHLVCHFSILYTYVCTAYCI